MPELAKIATQPQGSEAAEPASSEAAITQVASPQAFDLQASARLRYEVVHNFEVACQNGQADLAEVVSNLPEDLDPEARRTLVVDLVICDLQHRWKVANSPSQLAKAEASRIDLAEYGRLFPELRHAGALPVKLKVAEFRCKRAAGKSASLNEYLESGADQADGEIAQLAEELIKAEPMRPVSCASIWQAMGACAVLLLVQLVGLIYLYSILPKGEGDKSGVVFIFSSLFVLLVAHLMLTMTHGEDRHRVVGSRLPSFSHLLITMLLVVPTWICIIYASTMLQLRTLSPGVGAVGFQRLDDMYVQVAMEPWWILILAGCILPAIAEELFFRAAIGRGLIRAYGAIAGVLLTSLLFGLFHFDPIRIFGAFFLGLILHMVYLATKSIVAPMLFHGLNNFCAFSVTRYRQQRIFDPSQGDGFEYISPALMASSIFFVVIFLVLLYKTRAKWYVVDQVPWSAGWASAESPPVSIPAKAVQARAGSWLTALCAVGLIIFGASFVENAVSCSAINQGNLALDKADDGEIEIAQRLSKDALKLRPQFAWMHACRAWVLMRSGALEEAVAAFNKAIELDAQNAMIFIMRAMAMKDLDNLDKALADCDAALRLRTDIAIAFTTRASTWLAKNQPEKALKDATQAVKLDPEDFMAWQNRGDAQLKLGQHDSAIADFTKVIALEPKGVYSHFQRSQAYQHQRQLDKAAADLARCIELEGEQHYLLLARGKLQLEMDLFTEALTDLRFLLTHYPTDRDIRLLCAEAYRKSGDEENAMKEEQAADDLQPK